jgi:hypothetical protein
MRPGVYAARPAAARRAADQTQQRLDQNLGHHRQQLVGVVDKLRPLAEQALQILKRRSER